MKSLFDNARACLLCGAADQVKGRHRKLAPGSPSILSLNVTIYRRTAADGRQLATTERVRICEACLAKVCAGDPDLMTLAGALAEQISKTFAAMVDGGKGADMRRHHRKAMLRLRAETGQMTMPEDQSTRYSSSQGHPWPL